MVELKTIKDFCEKPYGDECGYCHYCKYADKLRNEVIKWINSDMLDEEYINESGAVRQWIQHFFNIPNKEVEE